jgi:hypothetical protein
MFAAKINEAPKEYFDGRRFNSVELKEISMAGWMHDIGKIVTPEFIMDKSTKLEAIIDRIDLVMLRIEKLELLLNHLEAVLPPVEFQEFLHQEIDQNLGSADYQNYLKSISDFLEKMNMGEEFVAEEDLQKVERISAIDFDYAGKHYFILSEDEKRNMMIKGRGTFTPDQYQIMKDHVSITWEMLSKLSFPKKYKNVAFYASTHHETLNGRGYPRGIGADQLPLQSRIIAVADIFEALTAADRPYKKAKTLSEALTIVAFMVKDGHLDKDLVNYFLDSGLYLEYAKQFMKPEYTDEVNVAAIKSKYTPA